MAKFIDLTGQEFADGNIKVIRRAPDAITPKGSNTTMWECLCICGNIFLANGYRLRKGLVKSCGCKSLNKIIDLTNKTFENLFVIERADDYIYSNGNRKSRWKCKCDCGKEIIVLGESLIRKHTKSCGCLKKELLKKYNTYDLFGEYGIGYTIKGEEFYFDLDDYDIIQKYCWYKNSHGYLVAKDPNNRKDILQHRLIMNAPENKIVDHINHNIYDNRKNNLRLVDKSQNGMNHKISSANTSGVSGVIYHETKEKWVATITVQYERINLGDFENKEDAIKVRKEAEEKYYGEYSYDNSMKGEANYE